MKLFDRFFFSIQSTFDVTKGILKKRHQLIGVSWLKLLQVTAYPRVFSNIVMNDMAILASFLKGSQLLVNFCSTSRSY